MNIDTKNLAFGGMCGGFIAGLLGLAIVRQYGLGLWTIVPVAFLGGCIGWIACDFAGAKRSAQTAWRQAVGWKPDVGWWKCFTLSSFAVFVFCVSLVPWISLVSSPSVTTGWDSVPIVSGFIGAFFVLWWAFGFFLITMEDEITYSKIINLSKIVLVRWNVVTIPLSIVWYIGKGALWVLVRIPFVVKTAGQFWWRVFVLAHSDKRRICFIGTTLGTASGFYLGYVNSGNLVLWALFSGVLGAMLSIAWHEVVAVRWLGLKNV